MVLNIQLIWRDTSETFFQNQNFARFHKNREENFVERRTFANLANINIVMSLAFWESRSTFFKLIFTEAVTETEIIYLFTKQRTEYNYSKYRRGGSVLAMASEDDHGKDDLK
jgi:hypothetical protein